MLLHALKQTAKGATITLGSTVASCALAIQVEKSANRLFFWWAPHRYAGVERASGLTQSQLDSVRHLATKKNAQQQDDTSLAAMRELLLADGAGTDAVEELKGSFSETTVFTSTKEIAPNRKAGGILRTWTEKSSGAGATVGDKTAIASSTKKATSARTSSTPVVLMPVEKGVWLSDDVMSSALTG